MGMDKWRDIETAPRDGFVLLWLPGRVRCAVGQWDNDKFSKRPRPFWNWHTSREECRVFSPTHWMPLPPPPQEPTNGCGCAPGDCAADETGGPCGRPANG